MQFTPIFKPYQYLWLTVILNRHGCMLWVVPTMLLQYYCLPRECTVYMDPVKTDQYLLSAPLTEIEKVPFAWPLTFRSRWECEGGDKGEGDLCRRTHVFWHHAWPPMASRAAFSTPQRGPVTVLDGPGFDCNIAHNDPGSQQGHCVTIIDKLYPDRQCISSSR